MIEAYFYGRTSGSKQEKEKTIETQRREVTLWAAANGYKIVGEYLDPGVGNETPWEQRKDGRRLIEEATQGKVKVILINDSGRLSRLPVLLLVSLQQFAALGVEVISLQNDTDQSSDEAELFTLIKAGLNRMEVRNIQKKTKAGKEDWCRKQYVAEDGELYHYWMGGRTPYGYEIATYNRRRGLRVDEEEIRTVGQSPADIIRQIFNWAVIDRIACEAIGKRLTAGGIPKSTHLTGAGKESVGLVRVEECHTSREWQGPLIQQILTNPVYKGEHYYGTNAKRAREIVKRRVPAIVSVSLWNAAQVQLKDNRTYAERNSNGDYLLTGLIRCGYCPCAMSAATRYGGKLPEKGRWWYYCNAKCHRTKNLHLLAQVGLDRCINPPIRESIEAHVWNEVLHFIKNPSAAAEAVRISLLGSGDEKSESAVQLEKLIADRNKNAEAKRRARWSFENGFATQEEFVESATRYGGIEAELDSQIAQLETSVNDTAKAERHASEAMAFLAELKERAGNPVNWTFDRRREIVRTLVRGVVVHPPNYEAESRFIDVRYWFQARNAEAEEKGTSSRSCNNRFIARRHEIPHRS